MKHTPQNCRWAEPTLYLPAPYWLDAWNTPWSCHCDRSARLIESGEECTGCARWEPRGRDGLGWDVVTFSPLGR